MRENRTYGSEGGDRLIICSLPLSDEDSSGADNCFAPDGAGVGFSGCKPRETKSKTHNRSGWSP